MSDTTSSQQVIQQPGQTQSSGGGLRNLASRAWKMLQKFNPLRKAEENKPLVDGPTLEKAELKEIEKQRKHRLDVDEQALALKKELRTGLAISGGGIRSATFALGVLQALRELNLLRTIDYLSTVSGGGYIGSWLVANRYQPLEAERKARAELAETEAELKKPQDQRKKKKDELEKTLAELQETITQLENSTVLKAEADLKTARAQLKITEAEIKNTEAEIKKPQDQRKKTVAELNEALAKLKMTREQLKAQPEADAFLTDDSEHLRHLRRYSCYLTPRTSLMSADTWTAASIWLRNTFALQLLLGLFLLLLLLLPRLLSYHFLSLAEWSPGRSEFFMWTQIVGVGLIGIISFSRIRLFFKDTDVKTKWHERMIIGIAMVGSWVLAPALWSLAENPSNIGPATWSQANCLGVAVAGILVLLYLQCIRFKDLGLVKILNLFARLLALCVLSVAGARLACTLVLIAFEKTHELPFDAWPLASALGMPMILFAYSSLIGFGISASGANVPSRVLEWWSRIAAWLLIISATCCLLGLFCFQGPTLVQNLADCEGNWLNWKSICAALGWLATTGAGLMAGKSDKTNGASQKNWIKETVAVVAPYVFAIGLLLLLSFAAEELVKLTQKERGYSCEASATGFVSIVVLVLFLILALMLDINELSLNQFYRNRLMRCYLGGAIREKDRSPDHFTGLDFDDDVAMRNLTAKEGQPFPGPFWIVNTAMNTTNNPDMDVAERQAESFVFTPLHCGFYRGGFGANPTDPTKDLPQGYRELAHFGFKAGSSRLNKEEGVTAAFAVSASGAAASPNWGYHTAPVTAFLMTVFNVRLGWWLPNPAQGEWKKRQPWAMSRYALKELFGSASASDDCIYLSDGGHFENLGLYELIRRRCKLIILSDGEQDEGYKFEGLGMAIRRCWVDFGARIDIDVSSIKPKTGGGACGGHCAIGKIYYNDFQGKKDKPDAWLVYLKLSWTGDEDTDLQEYKAYNPAFPHDSTANQWFSESQFESYRKLGCHVAQTALKSTVDYLKPQDNISKLSELGRELYTYWTPSSAGGAGAFITNTEALMQIWKDVAVNPRLKFLDPLVLQWPDPDQPPQQLITKVKLVETIIPPVADSAEERAGRYLCQRLFQLMENVYVDLDLAQQHAHPDNSGWMELFKHWVTFKYFNNEWNNCKDTYGERFQAFWTQSLGVATPAGQGAAPLA